MKLSKMTYFSLSRPTWTRSECSSSSNSNFSCSNAAYRLSFFLLWICFGLRMSNSNLDMCASLESTLERNWNQGRNLTTLTNLSAHPTAPSFQCFPSYAWRSRLQDTEQPQSRFSFCPEKATDTKIMKNLLDYVATEWKNSSRRPFKGSEREGVACCKCERPTLRRAVSATVRGEQSTFDLEEKVNLLRGWRDTTTQFWIGKHFIRRIGRFFFPSMLFDNRRTSETFWH